MFASLDQEQKYAATGLVILALIAIFAIGRNYLRPEGELTITPLTTEVRAEVSVAAAPEPRSISLNWATEAELKTIPGIGDELARRIVAERQIQGGFKRIEDIRWVKGIGPDRAREFSQYLRL